MGLFMTDNSFDLDVMYGRNFLQTDNAQKVIIHKINIIESKSHALYGQSKTKDKKFLADATKQKLVDDYRETFANPYGAAALGYIDAVITPEKTRPRIIEALSMVENKRDSNPAKKHGNIPL